MRKYYLDNMKWFVILLVVLFHVVCIFSSCKAPMSYNADGIPALDAVGYLIYPWFMPCLFVGAGISMKYSIAKRGRKGFIRERCAKLLLPFAAYLALVGPFAADLTFKVNDYDTVFAELPGFVVVLIRIVNGMGPAWFLLQLFGVSLFQLLILKLDKKQRLEKLGKGWGLPVLLLLYLPVLLSAQILYLAMTFRNGLYFFLFFLGYYVFSREEIMDVLKKYALGLLAAGIVAGIIQTVMTWGQVYQQAVNHWLVMLYTWLMVLAVFGCFARFFNRHNPVTDYLSEIGFGIYLFHYVPMIYLAYFLVTGTDLPIALIYILVLAGALAGAALLTETVRRIPFIRNLFGLKKPGKRMEV